MVKGHPDYQTQEGTAVGGSSVDSYSFSGSIASGVTGVVDIPVVPTDEQHFYQNLVLSCPDDTAIHEVTLLRISDAFVWWTQDFILGGNWNIPGFAFPAAQQLRISITNNSGVTLDFTGAVFRTIRSVA